MSAITQAIYLRVPPDLYRAIKQNAEDKHVSLNEYITQILQDRIDTLKDEQQQLGEQEQ